MARSFILDIRIAVSRYIAQPATKGVFLKTGIGDIHNMSNSPAAAPKQKILLVDDVPANLDVLLQMLEPAGFFVMVANNGEKGLKIATQTKPDLILLDIMMPPGIDGYEVCARLKAGD